MRDDDIVQIQPWKRLASGVQFPPAAQKENPSGGFLICRGESHNLLWDVRELNAGACHEQQRGTRGVAQPEERGGATRGEGDSLPRHTYKSGTMPDFLREEIERGVGRRGGNRIPSVSESFKTEGFKNADRLSGRVVKFPSRGIIKNLERGFCNLRPRVAFVVLDDCFRLFFFEVKSLAHKFS